MNLPKAKFKSNELIFFLRSILKQCNIVPVAWLVPITLMWGYNEKQQMRKEETQNVPFGEKKSTRQFNYS